MVNFLRFVFKYLLWYLKNKPRFSADEPYIYSQYFLKYLFCVDFDDLKLYAVHSLFYWKIMISTRTIQAYLLF
jgi:hypothetical protein